MFNVDSNLTFQQDLNTPCERLRTFRAIKTQPSTSYIDDGGARRDRTADLLHAMQALSQLSYSPEKEKRSVS